MTTDNQNEIFDLVDTDDKVIGRTTRSQVHQNPNLIHRSIGVAVFNSNKKIFLQRRSVTKDIDALLWTISCSGHVLTGENYEDTACRELEEELGIKDTNLILLTKYLYKGTKETEITSLFKANYDGEITLLKEEILEGKFFGAEELSAAIDTGEIELNLFGRLALEKLGFIIVR